MPEVARARFPRRSRISASSLHIRVREWLPTLAHFAHARHHSPRSRDMPSRSQTSNQIRRHRLYLALLATGMAFTPLPSQAGSIGAFVVDTVLDTQDANPGDGQALDSAGRTSLRAAIDEANALGGARAI